MGFESFTTGIENSLELHQNDIEKFRASQAANFEKVFQNRTFAEGTEPRHITTINEKFAGEKINGVTYARKIFELNGELVEGVFPIFESKFNVKLPENMYQASDNEQMRYCTAQLAERIDRNPKLASRFTARQLEQIRNGEPRISGLTWHHNESPGLMQLVDANDHTSARHTGGRSLWGGGGESR